MHGVEAVRHAQEVGRGLRRAAYARELHDLCWINAHFEEAFNDALRNRIVTAPSAERRLEPAIGVEAEADPIGSLGLVPGSSGRGAHSLSSSTMASVTVRASKGMPP